MEPQDEEKCSGPPPHAFALSDFTVLNSFETSKRDSIIRYDVLESSARCHERLRMGAFAGWVSSRGAELWLA
jgi:hypothetical protein